jgi:hypothetical protein
MLIELLNQNLEGPMSRNHIIGLLVIIIFAFSSSNVFGKCTDEQKARMITNNISQEAIDKQCSENKQKPLKSQESTTSSVERDTSESVEQDTSEYEKPSARQKGFHDFVGVSWESVSTTSTSGSITLKGSASMLGFTIEKLISENIYIGFTYGSGFVKYDIANSTSYFDGTLSATAFTFGSEIELSKSLLIDATITQSNGSSDLTLHVPGSGTATTSISVSGQTASVSIVMPSEVTRLSLGISKGIGGDYSDNKMNLTAALGIQTSPDYFALIGLSTSDDSTAFGVQAGICF